MGWFSRQNLVFASVIPTLALGIFASVQLARLDIERQASEERGMVVAELATVRARLEGIIESTFNATQGLVDLVGIQGGISPDLFAAMAALASGNNYHIRNISMAPNDVVAMVHPLAGNAKVIGFRYVDNPEQLQTVRQARERGRPVLAGPLELVQGGRGLINRTPIFTRKERAYWGVVSVVAHVDTIFATAGVTTSQTLRIALRGKDGKGSDGDMIEGDASVFTQSPVLMSVQVQDGSWQLGALPRDGWLERALHHSRYLQFGLFMTGLLVAILGLLAAALHQAAERNMALEREMRVRRKAEEELRLAATVFSSSAEGVVITDADARIVSTNRAFSEITGYAEDEVRGHNPRLLKSERHEPEFYQALWAALNRGGVWQGEIWNRRKNGEVFPEWLTISAVRDSDGLVQNYVAVFSDITTIKRSQSELEHLAHFDPLTDLPNRVLFRDRLGHDLERASRHEQVVALLLLDLDGFKTVNDSLGHPMGDRLLQMVAQRLRACIRQEDTVARLGGDEFAIILTDLPDGGDAVEVARKILSAIQEPFDLDGQGALVTASLGIAIFPADGDNTTDLVRNADAAMYGAKEAGRNNYRFYQATMTVRAQARLHMEQALRQGIERGEFEVWLQPQIDLDSGAVIGAEALARWRSPQRGLVSPAEFIPLAERTGLIVPLGRQILCQVCAHARDWRRQGLTFGKLSVNVATPQIERSDFVATLQEAMSEADLPGSCLEIEVTESLIMENTAHAHEVLLAVQQLGVTTAVDDFGTGYSSLAYLKTLPIDHLKIDRAFIKDLPHDPNDVAIARAIIAMGHSLGFAITAEGIETVAQQDFLRGEGCDRGQGYLFGHPMPAAEFAAWLAVRQGH